MHLSDPLLPVALSFTFTHPPFTRPKQNAQRATFLFCTIHLGDAAWPMPVSTHVTIVRLLLNLLECVVILVRTPNGGLDLAGKLKGRAVLTWILECYTTKVKHLRQVLPYLLEEAKVERAAQERYKAALLQPLVAAGGAGEGGGNGGSGGSRSGEGEQGTAAGTTEEPAGGAAAAGGSLPPVAAAAGGAAGPASATPASGPAAVAASGPATGAGSAPATAAAAAAGGGYGAGAVSKADSTFTYLQVPGEKEREVAEYGYLLNTIIKCMRSVMSACQTFGKVPVGGGGQGMTGAVPTVQAGLPQGLLEVEVLMMARCVGRGRRRLRGLVKAGRGKGRDYGGARLGAAVG